MSNQLFGEVPTWEEQASSLSRRALDIDRLMAAVCYRFEHEKADHTDVPTILTYYRRARWPQPKNMSSLTNHCAGKGWLSEAGRSKGKKMWTVTRKGYEAFKARMAKSQQDEKLAA